MSLPAFWNSMFLHGCTSNALGTCQNKTLTKRILGSLIAYRYKIIKSMERSFRLVSYPHCKPVWEDASVGIENDSIVNNDAKEKD